MQRAIEHILWEFPWEGGCHTSGGEVHAILASSKHRINMRRRHILFSVRSVVMKKQPQPILYKVEKQKKEKKSKAVMYDNWILKRMFLPQSGAFPSHITSDIASRSKECHG